MSAPAETPAAAAKSVQRYAYLALAAAFVLGAALVMGGEGELFGLDVGPAIPLAALLAGAVVAAVGIHRHSDAILLAGGLLAVLAVLPGGTPRPSVLQYALGVLFGLALLATGEMVHMSHRQQRAQRAATSGAVPAEHVARVTGESLRTFAGRAGLALGVAALGLALAQLLAVAGPAQWRAATETSAPLGVAVATLALMGAASLYILVRGARFELPARRATPEKESPADVAE